MDETTNTNTNEVKYTCPECKNDSSTKESQAGNMVECPSCGTNLEVISVESGTANMRPVASGK